ncbi:MAG: glycosyltransferase family 39 protein, partial [Candidatus Bathyarchaeota archaeon]
DGIYAASCWLMKQGYQPYTDFSLVQPPLFYWIVLAIWNATNLSDPFQLWALAKLVSLTSFIATTFLIYMICSRRLNNPTAGIAGSLIYQLSYDNYNFSVSSCPQIPATFLMVAAIYILLSDRGTPREYFLTGLFLGLATITRFSTFFLIPIFSVYLIWQIYKGNARREAVAFAIVGMILPLLGLLTIPFDVLKRELLIYHLTKSVAPTPIQLSLIGMIKDFTAKEPPALLGSISLAYVLIKREPKQALISGAAVLLLATYLSQPVLTSQHLIESIPFFSIVAAICLTGFIATRDREDRKKMIVVTVCLLLLALYFAPDNLEYGKEALRGHSLNHILRRLVRSAQQYSDRDEMIFSQLTVIPFLAGRRCPPIADIDWVNLQIGLFTADTVIQLIEDYPLKLVIITHRTEREIREFMGEQNYTRVERIDLYRIYVKGV